MIGATLEGLGRIYLTHEDLAMFSAADISPPCGFPRWVFLTIGDAAVYAEQLVNWAHRHDGDRRSLVALMLAGDLTTIRPSRCTTAATAALFR